MEYLWMFWMILFIYLISKKNPDKRFILFMYLIVKNANLKGI